MKFCPVCGTEYADDIRFCQRDGQTLKSANPSGDLVGQVIADRYHVTKKLGEGGMGAVYLAEHVKMGRKSAIKVMSSSMSQDPDAVSRFNREANNASRIQHPNICAIYDFGETSDGLIYLAMEFIEGASLNDILKKSGPMTLQRATSILRQTAEALHVAHTAGIVHRDLKPDNIMIAQQAGKDLVKVVDFGIAKAVGGDESGQKVTKTGLVVGTPEYMSPEQLSGDKLDGRSDLYSLALVYYRMITGTLPFVAETSQETMIKRLTDDPMPLHQALPTGNFPPALQAAMDRALARYAGERYSDAVEFAKDVEEALVGFAPEGGATMVVGAADMKTMVAGAPPKTSAVPKTRVAGAAEKSPTPVPAEKKKSPVGLIAAGVTVLALVGGGFAFKDKFLGGTGSDTTATVRPESTTVARPESTTTARPDTQQFTRPVPGNDPPPTNPRPNPGNTPTRDIPALEAEVNAMITPIIEGTNLEKRAAVRRAQEIFGYTDIPRDLRGLAASTAGSGYVEIAREAELSGDNVQARGSFQSAADWFERAMQYRPTSSTRDALQMARSKVSALDSN